MPTKEIAKQIALLPQVLEATEDITVYELVSYGRFPHQSYFGQLSDIDKAKIKRAMEMTKITNLANKKSMPCPVDNANAFGLPWR